VKHGDKQQVIPPNNDSDGNNRDIKLFEGKNPDTVKLQTPGHVKSEMGRIYRAVLKGKLSPDTGRVLIQGQLTPILKATEIEQVFNLANDDPEADTPALTGLVITGPIAALPEGVPARRLDGPDNSTTSNQKGKTDDQTTSEKEGHPDKPEA